MVLPGGNSLTFSLTAYEQISRHGGLNTKLCALMEGRGRLSDELQYPAREDFKRAIQIPA
jgi:hypothetical protein